MNPAGTYMPDGSWEGGGFFRSLSAEEVVLFQRYAKQNDPPSGDWSFLHPVCRDGWRARGLKEICDTCGGQIEWRVCGTCGNDWKSPGALNCPVCLSDNTWAVDGFSDGEASDGFTANDCCGGCALPDSRRFE